MEGDPIRLYTSWVARYFNPLPPHGGRLGCFRQIDSAKTFQSTPSAWRETEQPQALRGVLVFQSTPSAWRETNSSSCSIRRQFISIHSLRMEGDCNNSEHNNEHRKFQSTPSAWRETSLRSILERRQKISIHSLRMEGDPAPFPRDHLQVSFQSTPSAWRETVYGISGNVDLNISIHSLRMEGDNRTVYIKVDGCYFNPLPPHGGRQAVLDELNEAKEFQSTPSAWRETAPAVGW